MSSSESVSMSNETTLSTVGVADIYGGLKIQSSELMALVGETLSIKNLLEREGLKRKCGVRVTSSSVDLSLPTFSYFSFFFLSSAPLHHSNLGLNRASGVLEEKWKARYMDAHRPRAHSCSSSLPRSMNLYINADR